MSVIDSKIVEMKFDNRQFESNVSTSMNTLSKLKQSLNMDGASKGLDQLASSTRNFDFSPLSNGVESIKNKFSALEVMGVTALVNITNSAINAGKRISSALTIDPIKTGFQEYETQINAVQTILANTSSKGSTLTDVNAALDELNTYADKTIYNFTEMTRNIGTFTAAGVDLDTSVNAIKGIANLAAVSGSTSQQASTAMYQLSQALAAGKISLQDWNSVVNAGMGGQVFQDALIRTSELMGTGAKAAIEAEGSFRESLTKTGWLTKDVLTETLNTFTGDLSAADLAAKGYSESQIQEILKMGETANDAATKVKTFTQLWDTLKEAAQSGWTQSWEIIVGDFEEAKGTLTQVSDVIGAMIGKSAEARNNLLQGWKDLGGRDSLINSVKNSFQAVMNVVTPIKEAFREIFPPMTAQTLYNITKAVENFTSKLVLSEGNIEKLKITFKGLFSVLGIVVEFFKKLGNGIASLIPNFSGFNFNILDITSSIGQYLINLKDSITQTDIFGKSIGGMVSFLQNGISKLKQFGSFVKEKIAMPGWEGFLNLMKSIWEFLQKVGSKVGEVASKIGKSLSSAFRSGDIGSALDLVNGGLLASLLIALKKVVGGDGLKDFFENLTSPLENLKDKLAPVKSMLDEVKGCLEAYQQNLKAGILIKIAGAIAILVGSLLVLSMIDPQKLTNAVVAMSALFTELLVAMSIFEKFNTSVKDAAASVTMMVGMSVTILLLTGALAKLSTIDTDGLIRGIAGVGALMAEILIATKAMEKIDGKALKGATNMILFGAALKILASVAKDLSVLSWTELAKGLAGVGGLLAEVSLFLNTAKFSSKAILNATGIVILSSALKILASVCHDFSGMNWEEISKGLVAVGGLLAELSIFTNLAGNAKHVISTGVSLTIIAASMKIFYSAMKDFASFTWDEIIHGLSAMAGVLAEVTIAVNLMPKNMIGTGAGLVIVSSALLILGNALGKFSGFSWSEIAKGLVSLGGSLAIVAIGLNAMVGTLSGSAALLVAASALLLFVPVLKTLGSMSWGDIAKGLVAIAGAFTVIGIAGLLLGPVVPAILGLAGAFALIGLASVGIGVGLLAISTAITSLAVAGTAGATAIVAALTIIVTGIANMIPTVVSKIGEAIVVFCQVIGDSAGAICESAKKIILALVDMLVECAPVIADGAFKLVVAALEMLVQYTPQIVSLLFDFLINVINSVADKIPDLIQAAVNLVMSFFSGIVSALQGIDTDVFLKGIAGIGLLSAMMVALGAVSTLVPAAMIGVLGMGIVMAELIAILAIAGGINQIPGLNWLIGEGGKLLGNIGHAIGSFVGGIVGGIIGGISSEFPKIAKDLSMFMSNIKPFLDGASTIDASMLDGVNALAKTILILTAANIIDGITSFITGGRSLSKFASELVPFGAAMKEYGENVKGIDGSVVEASASAGKTLAEMAKTIPNSGGVVGFFAGENDMDSFAKKLVPFGAAMKAYSFAVMGINPDSIISSATAGKSLVELAKTLPNVGGVVGFFKGETDMVAFSKQIVPFGAAMKVYSFAVYGMKTDAIVESATAGQALIELSKTLPKTGGALQFFTGKYDLSGFAKQLVSFGAAMKAYSFAIMGINPDSIISSATAGEALISLAKTLPKTGGAVEFFTGKYDLSGFAKQLALFGGAMKAYSFAIMGINPETIVASTTAGESLIELSKTLPKTGGFGNIFKGETDITNFSKQIILFGSTMKAYSFAISGINVDSISASATAGQSLLELSKSLPNTGGVLQMMNGQYDLAGFSKQIVLFGAAMKAYSFAIMGINPETIVASTTAGKALIELSTSLPNVGGVFQMFTGQYDLSSFSTQLTSFGKAMKDYSLSILGINPETIVASTTAGKALIELNNTLPNVGGVVGWFNGEIDLAGFSTSLIAFGHAMSSYSATIMGIDPNVIINSTTAGKALIELANTVPGARSALVFFNGEQNMETFQNGIVSFGKAMKDYSLTILGVDPNAVINSITAGNALLELAKTIPSAGSVVQFFNGDKNMEAFSLGIVSFGKAMRDYSLSILGINPETIVASTTAGKALVELANTIPSTGGVFQMFTGQYDLSAFSTQLTSFGHAMSSYSATINGIDTNAVINSTTAGKALVELANTIPTCGGLLSFLNGAHDMAIFSAQLNTFGKAIKNYSVSVIGVDNSAITNSVSATKSLVQIANEIPNTGGLVSLFTGDNTMGSFGASMVTFGTNIKKYSVEVTGINLGAVNTATSSFRSMVQLCKDMEGVNFGGLNEFGASLRKVGKDGVDNFIQSFENAASKVSTAGKNFVENFSKGITSREKTVVDSSNKIISKTIQEIKNKYDDFRNVGKSLTEKLASGIKDGLSSAKTAFGDVLSSSANYARSLHSQFYDAGAYVAQGLANGISANAYLAEAKAKAMADAALAAAKAALKEHSPSKAFYQVGSYAGEGFVNAFTDYEDISFKAGKGMAENATSGLQSAISKASLSIQNGIDTQPTIRPVLDLSDISSGMNSLFGNKSIGLAANISTSMARSSTQSTNDDVISAINKLGNSLSGGGNTYTINGITYDDGSNISSAVQTLIRATKMERRI